jgi:hypothetical protein
VTNPDDLLRHFTRPAGWWLKYVVAVLLLSALVLVGARPAWRAIKDWRADRFLRQAADLLEQKQFILAFERARSALQLVPGRADALRMNARLLAIGGSETSLVLWEKLVSSGQASPDDVASFVEASVQFHRPDLVAGIVDSLRPGHSTHERTSRAAAIYLLHARRIPEALPHARDAYQGAPFNPTNALLLARLLAIEGRGPARAEARELFWRVAQTNGALRLEALRRVTSLPGATRSDRERVCDILSGMSDRDPAAAVLLAETLLKLNPARESEIVSNLVGQVRRDDPDQLAHVVEALVRMRRFSDALALTAAGRAKGHRRLFMARYEALVGSGRNDEAYRHVLAPDVPLPPFDLDMLRVRAAERAGDLRRRDAHLRDLLRTAGDHTGRIRAVAELAEEGNTRDSTQLAVDGWKRLVHRPGEVINALRHLQKLADRSGDTWMAREYARQAARHNTADSRLQLELAYYDLLLGENVERALAEAERQAGMRTNDFFARAVAALGHLRAGAPEVAHKLIGRAVLDESRAGDAMAVLVATYGAMGFETRARELTRSLPLSRLRPEELDLIRPWLLPADLGSGEALGPLP